jgi:GC-rich sequence DNA-binding factor
MISTRRNADDSDDLALFLGIPPAPTDEIEDVDEMGRSRRNNDAGPSSGIRIGRRADRERRRARRRERKANEAEEGYSTDSTLAEGDAEDYGVAQHQLGKRVVGLLEDVKAEDFRDPEKGLAVRFGEWRRRYEDEYSGAFGGLSMVQAWGFWARGEMIGWEPMRVSFSGLPPSGL